MSYDHELINIYVKNLINHPDEPFEQDQAYYPYTVLHM